MDDANRDGRDFRHLCRAIARRPATISKPFSARGRTSNGEEHAQRCGCFQPDPSGRHPRRCAGWLPHERVSSQVCLGLSAGVGISILPKGLSRITMTGYPPPHSIDRIILAKASFAILFTCTSTPLRPTQAASCIGICALAALVVALFVPTSSSVPGAINTVLGPPVHNWAWRCGQISFFVMLASVIASVKLHYVMTSASDSAVITLASFIRSY